MWRDRLCRNVSVVHRLWHVQMRMYQWFSDTLTANILSWVNICLYASLCTHLSTMFCFFPFASRVKMLAFLVSAHHWYVEVCTCHTYCIWGYFYNLRCITVRLHDGVQTHGGGVLATFRDRPTESEKPCVPKADQSTSTAPSQQRKVKLQHSASVVRRDTHHQRLLCGPAPFLISLLLPLLPPSSPLPFSRVSTQ